jgi:putative transposase
MDAQHTKHVTYKLAYHFVWCPKYPKRFWLGSWQRFSNGKFAAFVKPTPGLGTLNVQADHVHLFVSAPPSIAPSQIVHTLKGTTGRLVFPCFPEIKKQLWGGAFWSRSYYMGSVGDMSVDTVLKYIELGQD